MSAVVEFQKAVGARGPVRVRPESVVSLASQSSNPHVTYIELISGNSFGVAGDLDEVQEALGL